MNQSTDVPSRFKPGDLVWANYRPKRHGKCTIWLAVVCQNFGSNDDQYTKLEERVYMGGFTRYYHVQSIGHSFEEAWLPQFELNMIKHELYTNRRQIGMCCFMTFWSEVMAFRVMAF